MTNEIEEFEALLEKATPGPWKYQHSGNWVVADNGTTICARYGYNSPEQYERDLPFIAAARNLLPTLLQSLKDKDAEIERLEKELKDAAEYMIESGIAT